MEDARPVDIEGVVSDLHAGLSDAEIIDKHELNIGTLREVYEKLMESEVMGLPELFRRPVLHEELMPKESMRRLPRHYLAFQVPVKVMDDSDRKGWITNLTEQGLAVQGMPVQLHETVTMEVKLRKLGVGPTIKLDAVCEWADDRSPDQQTNAGFRIVKISEDDLATLREFVRFISLE